MLKKLLDNIYLIPEREFDANMYLVIEDNEDLNLIDTGTGLNVTQTIKEIKEQFNTNELKRIILTHCHIDHSGGLHRLAKKFSPEVCVFEVEAPYIEMGDTVITVAGFFGADFPQTKVDVYLENESVLDLGLKFKIFKMPGHTHGSIILYEEEKKILISGDVVFPQGAFGRTDFPTGNGADLVESLRKISELDVEMLFPGHMPPIMQNANANNQKSYQMAKLMFDQGFL
ncbi:MAG: MBL fold metallo-hydrolase [Candidatus Helarchaeota archaeon]|nr:MBL fold metallo-hydrolase [Candidatus Helarchaeota archaeon]